MLKPLSDYQFIDIHYHASPDLYHRRYNAMEAGRHYQALNGAVVLKGHLGSTCVQATLAQHQGLPVFPSLVLNSIAGGIHYRVIMRALAEFQPVLDSKLIVHFPTITGRSYQSKLSRQLTHPYLMSFTQSSETLFNENHQLSPQVIDILKMANDYPIVLSTGHSSKDETYALIDACQQYKVKALLLNQPANPLTGLSAEELLVITQQDFVWVEQTALTYLLGHQQKEDFVKVLQSVPRVIYSSDLGQTSQMDIKNWLDYSNSFFDEIDLAPERKDELWRGSALKLLSI